MTSKEINGKTSVLLAEYKACHINRNHFDNLTWAIGTIFIAASFALLGISFQDKTCDIASVGLMALFALTIYGVWFHFHNQYIQPRIQLSYDRLREIEEELRGLGFNIRLHTTIQERDKREGRKRKGKWIGRAWAITLGVAWFLRIALVLFKNGYPEGILVILGIGIILIFYNRIERYF